MASVNDVRNIPVMPNGGTRPLLGDVADVKLGKTAGEIDRYNMQRVVSFTANVEGVPLGEASKAIRAAVQRAGTPPRGVTVNLRGQIPPLEETLSGLRMGLALSIGAIFLLLAAAFQSFRLALGIVLMLPAVLLGVAVALLLTNTTLNVQSFTGAIMAMGIAVANAILLVSFAERTRVGTGNAVEAAATGARERLRAVLMTATAMIAGMIPIALGAEQTAPLGRAVIGGLVAATFATLLVLPGIYAILQSRAGAGTVSLDPTDPESRWYEAR
jgi:multidrug efflux pump subunit AcrB